MATRRSIFTLSALALAVALTTPSAHAQEIGPPEKEELTIGFIKLTDMAPLAIAYERGYFEDEGLYVTLEAQANWKVVIDGVIDGRLDASHMLVGMPLASMIGYGTSAEVITPFSINVNGKGVTMSNAVWEGMKAHVPMGSDGTPVHPISASALKPVVEEYTAEGKAFNLGMVFPVSSHNFIFRYWLAAGGIHPGYYDPANGETLGQVDAEVLLNVVPPPQMPATMEAGTINGYSVGEPWNQQAVFKGIGAPVILDEDIFRYSADKVFGMTQEFAEQNPNTTARLVRALIRAAIWLDENENANRPEAVQIISKPNYVGADPSVIGASMTGTFEYEKGDVRPAPDFNVFFRYNASYPYYSDAVWYLTQMRRWGQIGEEHPDEWYFEMAAKAYRPDIYEVAAKSLIAEGLATAEQFPDFATETGYKAPTSDNIDRIEYDGLKPNDYINSMVIGLKGSDKP